MSIPRILFLSLLLILLSAPARAAEKYSDSARAFSFTFPTIDHWVPLNNDEIANAIQLYSPDQTIKPLAGFQLESLGTLIISATDYPANTSYSSFTLLQIQKIAAEITTLNPSEFLTAETPVAPALAAGSNHQVACFTNPPGFVLDVRNLATQARYRSFSFLGKNRLITLHFFVRNPDYPELRKSFEPIATSFRFGSSQATSFGKADQSPEDHTALGTYIFVAILFIAAGVTLYFILKKKPY